MSLPTHVARGLRSRLLTGALLLPTLLMSSLAACAAGNDSGWWQLAISPTSAEAATPDDDTTAGSFLAGQFALGQGDMREAATSFLRALEREPDNLDLRRQAFALLLASGEFERAVPVARDLIAIDPSASEATLLLAVDAMRRGAFEEATAFLNAVGNSGLTGTVQPILLAWALYAKGDLDAALAALGAAPPRGGLERLRAYHRASMLGLAGRPAEGLEALRAAFPDVSEAPPRILRTYAQLHLDLGDKAAAQAVIDQARAAYPEDPQVEWLSTMVTAGRTDLAAIRDPRSGMADAFIGIAEALADEDGAAQAMIFARFATFATPEDADPWLLVGRIELAQGNAEEAIRALEQVPASSRLALTARLLRADALAELERIDEAVALLEEMAAAEPTRADPLIQLGDLMRSQERFAEAESAYSRAIERLGPPAPRQWRLYYARGIAYERTQRWPQAEADLLKALELEPDQPFVLNYLGYSWVDQHLNLERAEEMLKRAVELRPEDGFIVDSLGWAYYRLGDYEKAVTYLERAVELEPGDPVINDHLGDAYWRVGRQREARFQWERALTFEPKSDLEGTIRDKLARGLQDNAGRPG